MYLIKAIRKGNQFEVVVGNPEDLFQLLWVYENSEEVARYKVIDSDNGPIKDFKVSFGWGNEYHRKNSPDGFTY